MDYLLKHVFICTHIRICRDRDVQLDLFCLSLRWFILIISCIYQFFMSNSHCSIQFNLISVFFFLYLIIYIFIFWVKNNRYLFPISFSKHCFYMHAHDSAYMFQLLQAVAVINHVFPLYGYAQILTPLQSENECHCHCSLFCLWEVF